MSRPEFSVMTHAVYIALKRSGLTNPQLQSGDVECALIGVLTPRLNFYCGLKPGEISPFIPRLKSGLVKPFIFKNLKALIDFFELEKFGMTHVL